MVLLVVDTQKLIANERLYQFETFVSHEKELIKKAREKGIEVIYVRHDDGPEEELTKGTAGYEIYDEFRPMQEEKIFDKHVNSAFRGTGLLEYLKEKGEQDIIVTGLQTDYCIDATVKCGFEHGFHVIVPATVNTTVDNAFMTAEQTYRYYNEFIWKRRYADCISFADMLRWLDEI